MPMFFRGLVLLPSTGWSAYPLGTRALEERLLTPEFLVAAAGGSFDSSAG